MTYFSLDKVSTLMIQTRIIKHRTNLLIQPRTYSVSYSINILSLENHQAIMTNKEGISWKLRASIGELVLAHGPATLSPAGYYQNRTCQASLRGYCVVIYKLLVQSQGMENEVTFRCCSVESICGCIMALSCCNRMPQIFLPLSG